MDNLSNMAPNKRLTVDQFMRQMNERYAEIKEMFEELKKLEKVREAKEEIILEEMCQTGVGSNKVLGLKEDIEKKENKIRENDKEEKEDVTGDIIEKVLEEETIKENKVKVIIVNEGVETLEGEGCHASDIIDKKVLICSRKHLRRRKWRRLQARRKFIWSNKQNYNKKIGYEIKIKITSPKLILEVEGVPSPGAYDNLGNDVQEEDDGPSDEAMRFIHAGRILKRKNLRKKKTFQGRKKMAVVLLKWAFRRCRWKTMDVINSIKLASRNGEV